MHVLIVSHLALPHVGGVENIVDYEIRALLAAGHRATLVTSDGTGPGSIPDYESRIRIIRVPAWHVLERRAALPYPIFSPRLAAVIWRAARDCDVIHVHGMMFISSVAAALAGRLRGRRVVLTEHGGVQQYRSRVTTVLARVGTATAGRLTIRSADKLISYNQRILDLLQRLGGRSATPVFLPNPVDDRLFRRPLEHERARARQALGWSPDRPKALFVGRLSYEKGVPRLLECAGPDFDLVFCGPGDVAMLGPLPRIGVEYLPARPHERLRELYHAVDLLVVPSMMREGFPLVAQEAVSCGLPVLLSYDPGFEPYRGLAGLTFHDPATDLKAAIRAALAAGFAGDPDTVRALCPSLQEWIERMYDQLLLNG